MKRWGAVGLALLSGVLIPLGVAPFSWTLAGLAAPACLFLALEGASPRQALGLAYLSGLGRYGLGVSWVYVSIQQHGGASPALAGALVALFVAFLALLPAAFGALYAALAPRQALGRGSAFVLAWLGLEAFLGVFLTGFPWLRLGYTQEASALAGYAPLLGVLGVSLVTSALGVAIAQLLAALWCGPRRAGQVLALLGVGAGLWLGGAAAQRASFTESAGPALSVALVQGAVPQQRKWDPAARGEIIARYERLSAPHLGADVLFWPEAALPVFAARAPGLLARLERSLAEAGSALVLGIPDLTPDPAAPDTLRFLNTAQVLGAGSGRYVKHHLVPFGEYVPLEGLLRGLITFLDLPMSRALPGPAAQPALVAAGQRWATPICYEVVCPSLVRGLARDATVLATLSNDAWFGDSLGPEQHHQMARFRARELGRPMVRVTNDGVTALINAKGAETARLPRFSPAVLTGEVQPQRGLTPYARFGDGPLWALALGLLGLALRGHRRDV